MPDALTTTVIGIRGRPVSTTPPTDGQALAWNHSAQQWQPVSFLPLTGGTLYAPETFAPLEITSDANYFAGIEFKTTNTLGGGTAPEQRWRLGAGGNTSFALDDLTNDNRPLFIYPKTPSFSGWLQCTVPTTFHDEVRCNNGLTIQGGDLILHLEAGEVTLYGSRFRQYFGGTAAFDIYNGDTFIRNDLDVGGATTLHGLLEVDGNIVAPLQFSVGAAATGAPNASNTTSRLILYPSAPGYALGLAAGQLWFGVSTTANTFGWYGGTDLVAQLWGNGVGLRLQGNAAGNAAQPLNASGLMVSVADATAGQIVVTSYGTGVSYFGGYRALGTGAAPTAVTAAGNIVILRAGAYDGSAWGTTSQIVLQTLSAQTTSDHSGQVLVQTVAAGAITAPATRATFGVNLTLTGDGLKPGGGAWTATSDMRTKRDTEPYRRGLDAVLALDPISWRYNGRGVAESDTRYYGLAAEAARPVMPEIVHELPMPLDEGDDPVPVLHVNATALIYALVNSVKELSARLAAVEGREQN